MNMLPGRRRLDKCFHYLREKKSKLTNSKTHFREYNPLQFETASDYLEVKDMLNLMIEQGYVETIEYPDFEGFSQVTKTGYKLIGNIETFNAWLHDQEKKAKKITRREWRIAIVSAIIGAAIGLIPFIVSLFTTSNTSTP